ncbi:MAG: PadR family transcriptional regulator [Promethearchaeota archaeon]|jgi:DNA-binding PadR family transcriptional regulator
MIEEIAEKFEKAMKKGFISTLTLLVLDKEPMHGRLIKRAIEERTFGVWTPTDSTMYTILGDLREKNLIKQLDQQDTDGKPKIITYKITEAGKNTLEIMMKKEQEIRESMRSIITSTFGFKDELMDIDAEKVMPPGSFIDKMLGKPAEDTLQSLNFQRVFLGKRIEVLNKMLQGVINRISKLEKEK